MEQQESPMALGKFDQRATLSEIHFLAPDLFTIKVQTEPIDFVPGQYFSIVFPGVKPAPFSIASAPGEPLEFGIRTTGGPVTSRLAQLKLGDAFVLRGPFGRFTLGDAPALLVAAGTGITPFMSMLRAKERGQIRNDLLLVIAAQTRDRLLWRDELLALQESKVLPILSREKAEGFGFGRLSKEYFSAIPDLTSRTAYVCGPPAFIKDITQMLLELGVKTVHSEGW
jgi:NAD(P)H-flavin reductase